MMICKKQEKAALSTGFSSHGQEIPVRVKVQVEADIGLYFSDCPSTRL
jgi:hypothetical protein